MRLNVTAIADVCLATLRAYNQAIGDPSPLDGEAVLAVLIESVGWVLDNPMRDEFGLLHAWGKEEGAAWTPAEVARAGLVRVIALELGGDF